MERLEEKDQERRKSSRQKSEKATGSQLKALLEDQQYCCALSGLPLTPETSALDHRTAVSNGGTHAIDNLQWLNADINKMKGNMDQGRFVRLCGLVAAHGSLLG
ncbi:MAG: HNH endonuclease [Caulobacteraceae bacterium]|nr:HNH endonuclease [Caulobacteraceae bacterium]